MASYFSSGHCHDSWFDAVEAWKSNFPLNGFSGVPSQYESYSLISVVESEPTFLYTVQNGFNLANITGTVTLQACTRPELLSGFSLTDITFLGFGVLALALGFLAGQQR